VPPARSKTVPSQPFVTRVARRLLGAAAKVIPSRSGTAFLLVGVSPVLVGVGVGMELGTGWGLVAGGAGAFGVGWLLGAE